MKTQTNPHAQLLMLDRVMQSILIFGSILMFGLSHQLAFVLFFSLAIWQLCSSIIFNAIPLWQFLSKMIVDISSRPKYNKTISKYYKTRRVHLFVYLLYGLFISYTILFPTKGEYGFITDGLMVLFVGALLNIVFGIYYYIFTIYSYETIKNFTQIAPTRTDLDLIEKIKLP